MTVPLFFFWVLNIKYPIDYLLHLQERCKIAQIAHLVQIARLYTLQVARCIISYTLQRFGEEISENGCHFPKLILFDIKRRRSLTNLVSLYLYCHIIMIWNWNTVRCFCGSWITIVLYNIQHCFFEENAFPVYYIFLFWRSRWFSKLIRYNNNVTTEIFSFQPQNILGFIKWFLFSFLFYILWGGSWLPFSLLKLLVPPDADFWILMSRVLA